VNKIIQPVDQLKAFPKSGRVVPEFNNQKLRELIFKKFRIAYRVQEGYVGIGRIHYSTKDISAEI
jgi:toxin ParE1/3/4